MVSNPKISVIVPLYNCIEYFPQCMDSILAQSFKDFEIIVVDDGSTDGSYELAEQYAKTNGNVIVLQQEHRFAGVARNTGWDMHEANTSSFSTATTTSKRTCSTTLLHA